MLSIPSYTFPITILFERSSVESFLSANTHIHTHKSYIFAHFPIKWSFFIRKVPCRSILIIAFDFLMLSRPFSRSYSPSNQTCSSMCVSFLFDSELLGSNAISSRENYIDENLLYHQIFFNSRNSMIVTKTSKKKCQVDCLTFPIYYPTKICSMQRMHFDGMRTFIKAL